MNMKNTPTTVVDLTLDEKRKMLKQVFQENVLRIEFTKKDGSKREMVCTLMSDLYPEANPQLPLPFDKNDMKVVQLKTRKTSADVFCVYDLEKKGWRSFIIENLIDFTVVEDYGKNKD